MSCLGQNFALMEVKLVLASIMSEFKLKETESTPQVLEIDPKKWNMASVKGEAWVKVERHTNKK